MRFLLTGKSQYGRKDYQVGGREDIPDDCLIDFDMRLIDLFEEMDRKNQKPKEQIRNEYFRVKDFLGRRPSREELFTYMEDDIYQMAISRADINPFKRYLEFNYLLRKKCFIKAWDESLLV